MALPLTPRRHRLIDRLLDDLLDLNEEEREERLDALAERHPRVHKMLVRLLRASVAPTLAIGQSIAQLALMEAESGRVEENHLPAGTRLGPWRILGPAGKGGMGLVYEGERADGAFKMRAAIKLIRLRKRDLEERLQQERELMARLSHPGIARLIDGGETLDGGAYLVMEWIDGEDLSHAWRPGENTVDQTISRFFGLCDAISHAHQRLVIHGDIKPGNVRIDSDGNLRLLDFGISRLLQDGPATKGQPRAMTPGFAAPELQAGGHGGTTADIWALGALLFWMLTGQNPDLVTGSSIRAVTNRLPACPRQRDLAAILIRACQIEPSQRYASVGELASDLSRYQRAEPVSARPAKRTYLLARFIGRHRMASTMTVAALLGLASLSMVAVFQARLAGIERDRAQLEATRATQVSDFLVNLFEQADPGQHLGERLSVYELLDIGRDHAKDLVSIPDQQAIMLITLARVYRALGQPDQAVELARQAVTIDTIDDADWRAAASLTLARSLIDTHQATEAEQLLDRLARIAKDSENTIDSRPTTYPHHYLEILLAQARLANTTGNEERAIDLLNSAEALFSQDTPPRLQAEQQTLLGAARFQNSDYAMAQRHFENALELHTVARGARHPRTLDTINFLAQSLAQLGRVDEARERLMASLAIRQQVLQIGHPLIAYDLHSIGSTYWLERDFDNALHWWKRALETRQQQQPPDLAELSTTQNGLALALMETGQKKEAEAMLEDALENALAVYGREHLRVASIIANQGIPPSRRGELSTALGFHREALAIRRKIAGKYHHHTGHSKASIAGIFLRKGDLEEAERWLGKALPVYDEIFPESDHPQRAMLQRIERDLTLAIEDSRDND